MQTLQAQTGSSPADIGVQAGKRVQLAPGLDIAGFTLRFDRNEEIFGEEEEADFVYKVISGAVRDVRILSDGRRQIGAFHLPGEVFGLECGKTHAYSAEAVIDSEIALVRRSALDKAAECSGGAGRKLWDITARDLQRLQDHMLLLGRKSAMERVASFLMRMASRGGEGNVADLPMSRSDIADYLGLTIETVSRTLTQMVRDHLIVMATSRHILLADRLALAVG